MIVNSYAAVASIHDSDDVVARYDITTKAFHDAIAGMLGPDHEVQGTWEDVGSPMGIRPVFSLHVTYEERDEVEIVLDNHQVSTFSIGTLLPDVAMQIRAGLRLETKRNVAC